MDCTCVVKVSAAYHVVRMLLVYTFLNTMTTRYGAEAKEGVMAQHSMYTGAQLAFCFL